MSGADRWAAPLDAFAAAQRAEGLAEATVGAQVRRVRRFAEAVGLAPDEVRAEDAARWQASRSASPRTVKADRLAVAAFYRWALAARLVDLSPLPALRPVSRYEVAHRWADALAAFETAQAQRHEPATVAQRVKHVRRFAADHDAGPWDVDAEAVAAWLAALGCAERTRLAHRSSLRAFYRWAHASGRVAADPTAEPDRRELRLGVPDAWAAPLRDYRASLLAAGRPTTTVAVRMGHLERFARAHPSLGPFDVTLADLLGWLAGQRWAAETRRAWRSTLRDFYRWAEDVGHVEASPADRLPVVKPSAPNPRPAHEDEYAAALAKADPRDALALRLAAELGMRRAEVAVVHSRDLIGEPGAWALVVHGKGSRDRLVPVPDGLATTLRSLPAGYAFPGRDAGHLSPRWIGRRVAALLPPGVTMHALRHRFATLAYSVDRDVFTVQRLLGHASPATTQRYVATTPERMRDLVLAVSRG